jgi:hypothetical protein
MIPADDPCGRRNEKKLALSLLIKEVLQVGLFKRRN